MRNQRTACWTSLLGAGLLVLTACTNSGTNGTPAPATSPPASTAQGKKAPPVPAPLNSASLEADPCSAVTPDQVASLGLPQKKAKILSDPPGCSWGFVTGGIPAGFSGNLGKAGLQRAYDLNGDRPDFREFTVSGYPGNTLLPGGGEPTPGRCIAGVALRDDLVYIISVGLGSNSTPLGDSCELGKKVAGFVVENLKGKS